MAQTKPFGILPSNSASNIEPFHLEVADWELLDMKALLKLSRLAGPIYENSLPDGSQNLGVRRDWLAQAKQSWETEFSW